MPATLEIRMQSHEIDCFICGEPSEQRWGVPVFNGDIVSVNFPEEIHLLEGGVQCVCESCYRKHEFGEIPTFDRYYLHLQPGLINGAGI